ncbi:UNVERIFIED_CONTAM: hypothetical protein FKN15_057961 [Acipenser sinensis]
MAVSNISSFSSPNNLSVLNATAYSSHSSSALHYSIQALVSGVGCVILIIFGGCILYVILSDTVFKEELRYVLLVNLLLSNISYFCLQSVITAVYSYQVQIVRPVCSVCMIVIKTCMRSETTTLSTMALDRYVAVCWPFKHYNICGPHAHGKILLAVWFFSALQPVTFLVTEYIFNPSVVSSQECSFVIWFPQWLLNISTIFAVSYIAVCALVILLTYILIYREGKNSGAMSSTNIQARRTLLMHGVQMSFYVVPAVVIHAVLVPEILNILGPATYSLINLLMFVVFTVGQCFCPIIYGFYQRDIRIQCFKKLNMFRVGVAPRE